MKQFFIGLIVGIVLTTTGCYAILVEKAKKAATKENVEKVKDATESVTDTLKGLFN